MWWAALHPRCFCFATDLKAMGSACQGLKPGAQRNLSHEVVFGSSVTAKANTVSVWMTFLLPAESIPDTQWCSFFQIFLTLCIIFTILMRLQPGYHFLNGHLLWVSYLLHIVSFCTGKSSFIPLWCPPNCHCSHVSCASWRSNLILEWNGSHHRANRS